MKLTKYHKNLIRKAEQDTRNYRREQCDEKTEMIIRAVEKSDFMSKCLKKVMNDFDYYERVYRFSIEECKHIEKLVDDLIFHTCISISRNKQIHVVME